MKMVQTSSRYCHGLVAQIEHEVGRALAPAVREAFLQVPRQAFIDHYYEQQQLKTAPSLSDQSASEAWLWAIYQDQALTTQIDERGLPTSSSSQPSVMAVMLEELEIKPGMHILEIGTGTGYNAALLAVLVGDPHLVTTLEIDPTLVEGARPRIEQVVGAGMSVHVGNGIEGYEPGAPYDRIMATGSFLPVPWAWIEQLQPEGRLIMDLRGRLAGGLMTIQKHADGMASGQFLRGWRAISFMGLRSSPDALATLSLPRGYQRFPVQEAFRLSQHEQAYDRALHFCTYEQFHGQDEDVNLWLQWVFPGLSIKWKGSPEALCAVLADSSTQTVAILGPQEDGIEVTVRGERPLWSEILDAYQEWIKAGRPGRECFTLLIDPHSRQVMSME